MIPDPQDRLDTLKAIRRRDRNRIRSLIKQERIDEHRIEKLGRAGPTEQTLARLEGHAIDRLQQRNIISAEQALALEEIARAYSVLTWDVEVRLSHLERVDFSTRQCEDVPGAVRLIRHYTLWWDRLKDYGMQACQPIAIDVAVDGLSINAVARNRHMDQRTVKAALLDAVDMWVDVGRKRTR